MRRIAIDNESAGEDDVFVDADVFVIEAVVDEHGVANLGGINCGLNCRTVLRNVNDPIPLGRSTEDDYKTQKNNDYAYVSHFAVFAS